MASKNVLHDANTRNRMGIKELIGSLGYEGYGLFWAIKEQLTIEDPHTLPKNFNRIGGMFGVDAGLIKKIICDFELFSFTEDGSEFYLDDVSQEFNRQKIARKAMSDGGKKAMKNRWHPENNDGNAVVIPDDTTPDKAPYKVPYKVGYKVPYKPVITPELSQDLNNIQDNNIIAIRDNNTNINPNSNNNLNKNINLNLNNNSYSSCTELSLQGEKDLFGEVVPPEKPIEEMSEFRIILNDGSDYWISKKDLEVFKSCYQAFDVEQELQRLYAWTYANPTKRKTRRGAKRFINAWLARVQDGGGTRTCYTVASAQRRVAPLPMSKQQCKPPTIDDCPF